MVEVNADMSIGCDQLEDTSGSRSAVCGQLRVARSGLGVGPLSVREARELTQEIAETLAVAWDKVVEAYQRRVWEPLGYASWDAYCRAELGSTRFRLPAEEREEAVRSLRSAGLSTRAIAAATGQSHTNVRRDLSSGTNVPPARAYTESASTVTGRDDKSYTRGAGSLGRDLEEPIDAEIVEEAPEAVNPALVSGGVVRRRPLGEQARDAGWEIRRAAERVARIAGDDRLAANRQQVCAVLRAHLVFVAETVTAALSQLSDLNK